MSPHPAFASFPASPARVVVRRIGSSFAMAGSTNWDRGQREARGGCMTAASSMLSRSKRREGVKSDHAAGYAKLLGVR